MQTCKRGHALTPENIYVHPSHGRRQCMRCRNATSAERRRWSGRHPRETLNTVSNAPLRERFLVMRDRGEIDAAALAAKLGWYSVRSSSGKDATRRRRPDSVRVRRTLGVSAAVDGDRNGERVHAVRQTIKYEMAVEFAHALGMDPHEADV